MIKLHDAQQLSIAIANCSTSLSVELLQTIEYIMHIVHYCNMFNITSGG